MTGDKSTYAIPSEEARCVFRRVCTCTRARIIANTEGRAGLTLHCDNHTTDSFSFNPWPHPAPGEKHSLHPIQLCTFCGWLFPLQPMLWVWLGKGFIVLRSPLHGPSTKKMPFKYRFCPSLMLLFSCLVMSDSLQLYGLPHTLPVLHCLLEFVQTHVH